MSGGIACKTFGGGKSITKTGTFDLRRSSIFQETLLE
jgi:hypothetical protein